MQWGKHEKPWPCSVYYPCNELFEDDPQACWRNWLARRANISSRDLATRRLAVQARRGPESFAFSSMLCKVAFLR